GATMRQLLRAVHANLTVPRAADAHSAGPALIGSRFRARRGPALYLEPEQRRPDRLHGLLYPLRKTPRHSSGEWEQPACRAAALLVWTLAGMRRQHFRPRVRLDDSGVAAFASTRPREPA